MEVEPTKDSNNEVTYQSDCDDAVFSQICDFIHWFRNDSEMPEPPAIENKTLQLDTFLKTDLVDVDPASSADMLCFPDHEFNLFIPWARIEVKQLISFSPICEGLNDFGNFLRALYLLHAALIIFRK